VKKISILLADDHAILRRGVRMLLAAQRDFQVVGEASNGADAVRLALQRRPDVALIDLSMPGMSGQEVIQRIRAAAPSVRVLVLTVHDNPIYARMTLAAGASGHIVKDVDPAALAMAIRAVHQGHTLWTLGGSRRAPVMDPLAGEGALLPRMSRRERQVLELLARGYTNREVAAQLSVSVKTAETYRARLREKLGVRRRADFVRCAMSLGLLTSG
jgi:two-component system response regulator NreC